MGRFIFLSIVELAKRCVPVSLVRRFDGEESPLLHLARDPSAPRPVAMSWVLSRLSEARKRITCRTPHAIQPLRGVARL